MKVGDLVRCRELNEGDNYEDWLGLIIGEPAASTMAVRWVCSNGRHRMVEIVNHSSEELVLVNENR